MTAPRLRYQTIEMGALDVHLRTLRDRMQFDDPDGEAAALGIGSASWPLFGVLWDSGRVLAELMRDYDIAGRRVLEVGCGIGLASLVLSMRGADITATDHHPEAGRFLRANVALNGGRTIPFFRTGWADGDCDMGNFDLIIGSDLLYERGQAVSLSDFLERHAHRACEVLLVDPGREHRGRYETLMRGHGYRTTRRSPSTDYLQEPFGGQVLRSTR